MEEMEKYYSQCVKPSSQLPSSQRSVGAWKQYYFPPRYPWINHKARSANLDPYEHLAGFLSTYPYVLPAYLHVRETPNKDNLFVFDPCYFPRVWARRILHPILQEFSYLIIHIG